MPATIEWVDGTIRLIDQSKLPLTGEIVEATDLDELIFAIQTMKVRGAPALGIAGAMGVALVASKIETLNEEQFYRELNNEVRRLIVARPTAVNLVWGINRMMRIAFETKNRGIQAVRKALADEIPRIIEEDNERNLMMADFGAELVDDGDKVLTHCNAGALATAGYGTALGVVVAAHQDGKRITVYVDETRPCLQGARLSTWELMMAQIPAVLIVDSAAGLLMREGEITKVFVGADRIAANGDVANKIGTYPISVVARDNNIPFYVVAPTSTIDLETPEGRKIPLELRPPEEITMVGETQIAPEGVQVYNPAFDVTPGENVTAIITEKGIAKPPFDESLRKLLSSKG
ncbi:MAG: S-methyl-5-thioribose-1-phosphate isomerase [Actinobacteria bacterium]|nr:MAG: S-methyl-5-thioribose-1-phosphate isomerase [Actinomycetota bacterium]